jgi:hypothetical protein
MGRRTASSAVGRTDPNADCWLPSTTAPRRRTRRRTADARRGAGGRTLVPDIGIPSDDGASCLCLLWDASRWLPWPWLGFSGPGRPSGVGTRQPLFRRHESWNPFFLWLVGSDKSLLSAATVPCEVGFCLAAVRRPRESWFDMTSSPRRHAQKRLTVSNSECVLVPLDSGIDTTTTTTMATRRRELTANARPTSHHEAGYLGIKGATA